MTGMMNFQPQKKPQPTSSDMAPQNAEQGMEAAPEEQAQYEQFVKNGMELIYPKNGGVAPKVMETLKGPNPVEALASATAVIAASVQNSAMKNKVQLSGDVVMHGGKAIMEELATVATEGKVHDYTDEEMKAAAMRAVELFQSVGGHADQDSVKADFEAMMAADQSGELDRRFPALKQMGAQAEGQNGGDA
jgi:hypothetical protein